MPKTRIHTSPYQDILHQALTDRQYVEMVHFYAMSASLNVVLQTYIPPVRAITFIFRYFSLWMYRGSFFFFINIA